jgi:hypothetical protein
MTMSMICRFSVNASVRRTIDSELELNGLLWSLVQKEINLRDLGALKAALFAADGVDAGGAERGGDGGTKPRLREENKRNSASLSRRGDPE